MRVAQAFRTPHGRPKGLRSIEMTNALISSVLSRRFQLPRGLPDPKVSPPLASDTSDLQLLASTESGKLKLEAGIWLFHVEPKQLVV